MGKQPESLPELDGARLREIRQACEKATPGEWGWYGNTDTGHLFLATNRYGRSVVMGFRRWGMQAATPTFAVEREWGPHPDHPDELRIYPHGRMTPAHELPVYEVAPAATDRDDPQVYRADLIGIRHPDAEFIAGARTWVPQLVEEVERLRFERTRTVCWRRAVELRAERDALAAEIDKNTHDFVAAPDGEDICAATVDHPHYGLDDCDEAEDHPCHVTSRRVLAGLADKENRDG
ncbi:MAG: hypothetical protein L0Y54_03570 [Sporichthyaceae bacterium]|nr:hypothetical protein [Sporichthyaceae bacterium]